MALRLYPVPLRESMVTEPIKSERDDHDASLRTYDILTYPADYTLEGLVNKWNDGDIEIAPGQRKFVWNEVKASKLIESFLIGLPVPPIYLYQDRETSKLLVVDGQQRLKSLVYFFSGKFGDKTGNEVKDNALPDFELAGLHEKSPYFGLTYPRLRVEDEPAWREFKDSVMRAFIMKQISPDDDTSIYQVFERLNTGGMILYPQEIRNCILTGDFNDLLKEINQHESWRLILGKPTEDKRMRDVELILRFFALYYNLSAYEKPMKQFLNAYMRTNRNPSKAKRAAFSRLFRTTADTVVRYLGETPFSIHKRGLNAAVYDAIFTGFAKNLTTLDRATISKAKLRVVRNKFNRLLRDKNFEKWTSSATTDEDVVPKRIKKAIRTFR
jgi:uncharacterized protein with ParB-like and HNH nuclease domain